MDDYPDFDFIICLITTDGIMLVIQNNASYNEIKVS